MSESICDLYFVLKDMNRHLSVILVKYLRDRRPETRFIIKQIYVFHIVSVYFLVTWFIIILKIYFSL
jgi:hypothetical protein